MDKMNKKQLMAYIFQTLEYQIMNAVCEHIPDKLIQLRVHDAVYTRSPIFANDIQEIKLTLESICPYITLEHNKDSSAKGGDRHSKFKYSPSTEEEIIEHKQLIRQEETLAKDYENIYLSQSINY